MNNQTTGAAMERLENLMIRLRAENGCPWDREQTLASLIPYTIEEVYEVVEAVEANDSPAIREELGDLLFHVVFYSQIAREEKRFTLTEVITAVVEKMVGRHPHVFAEVTAETADDVVHQWEETKRREKEEARKKRPSTEVPSIFEGISGRLPALLWAYKVQQKMAKVGFDWPDHQGVLAKVREELAELEEAHAQKEADAIEEEMGDLLFVVANLARHLHVNPETALRRATLKFQGRFRYIEKELHAAQQTVQETGLEQLEALWQASKRLSKEQPP